MSEGVRFARSARPVICIIDHNLPRLTQLYSPGPARRDNMVPFALPAGWSAADGREEARVAEHSDAMIHRRNFLKTLATSGIATATVAASTASARTVTESRSDKSTARYRVIDDVSAYYRVNRYPPRKE
jgi:hypothetical protein